MKLLISTIRRSVLFAAVLLFVAVGTASAKGVKTDTVKPAEVQQGTYSVITLNYPVPIALLQKEGQPYDIRPVTSRSYKTEYGLSENQAIERAKEVLEKDPHVLKTNISEIKGPQGEIIGYELTPVYMPLYFGSFGQTGLGSVHYNIKGKRCSGVCQANSPDPVQ